MSLSCSGHRRARRQSCDRGLKLRRQTAGWWTGPVLLGLGLPCVLHQALCVRLQGEVTNKSVPLNQEVRVCELPLHISARACVYSSPAPYLPLSFCRPRDCHQSHCVPPLPLLFSPLLLALTSLFVSPNSIQQQLVRSHGCNPATSPSPSSPVPSFFVCGIQFHTHRQWNKWQNNMGYNVGCIPVDGKRVAKIQSHHIRVTVFNKIPRAAVINVGINNDDSNKDNNHNQVQRDLVDQWVWVSVCVGTWICHISSFAELQCYITRERAKGREMEIQTKLRGR